MTPEMVRGFSLCEETLLLFEALDLNVEQYTKDTNVVAPIPNAIQCYCVIHDEKKRATTLTSGLPWWLSSKESACNARDEGSIPGSGRSPAERNGIPLQYFCLGNPMDRGAWQAMVHGVARVGHDLGTKPPHPDITGSFFKQGR